MTRRLVRIFNQHPHYWKRFAWFQFAIALVLVTVGADSAPLLAGVLVLTLACTGSACLERARNAPLERAERAAKTAQFERDMALLDDPNHDLR